MQRTLLRRYSVRTPELSRFRLDHGAIVARLACVIVLSYRRAGIAPGRRELQRLHLVIQE